MARHRMTALAFAGLLGCASADGIDDPVDSDTDRDPTTDTDSDGDGVPDHRDCAPEDPNVFPGQDETCNGIDDDCDDQVDEGLTITVFTDADGDGWGDPATEARVCEAGSDQVSDGTDCDDADPAVHPGADEEFCDGTDNDCDPGTADTGVLRTVLDETTDVTAAFAAGTRLDPVHLELDSGARYAICDGTWYVNLWVPHTTWIEGLGESPSDVVIMGGEEGPGVALTATASLDIRNLTVAESTERALTCANGSIYLTDVVVRDSGGGMRLEHCQSHLERVTVTGNTAIAGAGIVAGGGGLLSMADSLLQDNTATSFGGALHTSAIDVSITDTTFTDNTSFDAGAWFAERLEPTESAPVHCTGCTFRTNTATSAGGAIESKDSELVLEDVNLTYNTAANTGGAILLRYGGTVQVTDGTLSSNTPDDVGSYEGLSWTADTTNDFTCDDSACE